jgi:hypothetical protein
VGRGLRVITAPAAQFRVTSAIRSPRKVATRHPGMAAVTVAVRVLSPFAGSVVMRRLVNALALKRLRLPHG